MIMSVISNEYIFVCMRPSRKAQNKAMRAYGQSEQYHTIVDSQDSKQRFVVRWVLKCLFSKRDDNT